ncbi:hypothetical protein Tco_0973409 [Tanacetum coccineum]
MVPVARLCWLYLALHPSGSSLVCLHLTGNLLLCLNLLSESAALSAVSLLCSHSSLYLFYVHQLIPLPVKNEEWVDKMGVCAFCCVSLTRPHEMGFGNAIIGRIDKGAMMGLKAFNCSRSRRGGYIVDTVFLLAVFGLLQGLLGMCVDEGGWWGMHVDGAG